MVARIEGPTSDGTVLSRRYDCTLEPKDVDYHMDDLAIQYAIMRCSFQTRNRIHSIHIDLSSNIHRCICQSTKPGLPRQLFTKQRLFDIPGHHGIR
jgi:hypothetical protein